MVWIRAVRRHAGYGPGCAQDRARKLDWPSLRLPPINLLNAPPSPWMLPELERESMEERADGR